MARWSWRAVGLWVLCGALVGAGCSDSAAPTQLLVIVEGDASVRSRADTLEVHIRGEKGDEVNVLDPIVYGDDEAIGWPRRVVIVPAGGDAERTVTVRIAAFEPDGSEAFVDARVVAEFDKGETLVVRVVLEEGCIDVSCAEEATCFEGSCVDPGEAWPVRPYEPDAGTLDGGTGDGDVGDGGSPQTGEPCSEDDACDSGLCVDGYCCTGPCDGECERCDMAGLEGTCSGDHNLCDKCQKCGADGACTLQTTTEDLKDECSAASCATGNCDGAGSCGVEPSGTDCGTCRSCDGSGSCQPNSTDHADCGTCQECVSGSCPAQAAGDDQKNDCSAYDCPNLVRGWDDTGTICEKYTGATSLNGSCDGSGSCSSLSESCTGAEATWTNAGGGGCTEVACRISCPSGADVSQHDELDELCYTSGPGDCPGTELCTPPYGDCEATCTNDGDCSADDQCCEENAPDPCGTDSVLCFCVPAGSC